MSTTQKITAKVETITPSKAKQMLERMAPNRNASERRVRVYSRAMASGDWKMTGEGLMVNGDGTLLNGQHRLLACIQAGVPFRTLVVRGVDHDAMAAMDQGRARTAAQILAMDGVKNSAWLAAAAAWVWRLRNRAVYGESVTPQEVKGIISDEPMLPRHVSECQSWWGTGNRAVSSTTIVAAVYHLACEIDEQEARDFFMPMLTGEMCSGNALILRRRLERQRTTGERKNERLAQADVAYLCIRAWNAERSGEQLRKLNAMRSRGVAIGSRGGATKVKAKKSARFPEMH